MKKTLIAVGILVALTFVLVFLKPPVVAAALNADADAVAEGKQLVDSKTSCESMTDAQLKAVGEYMMEQMHPGDAHEAMDKMMGLEDDPERDLQFHIHLARMTYCSRTGYGMMGMMGGIMGPGMMGNYYQGGMMNPGMMSASPWGSAWGILSIIFFIGLLLLIWLIVIKLWKEVFGRKK